MTKEVIVPPIIFGLWIFNFLFKGRIQWHLFRYRLLSRYPLFGVWIAYTASITAVGMLLAFFPISDTVTYFWWKENTHFFRLAGYYILATSVYLSFSSHYKNTGVYVYAPWFALGCICTASLFIVQGSIEVGWAEPLAHRVLQERDLILLCAICVVSMRLLFKTLPAIEYKYNSEMHYKGVVTYLGLMAASKTIFLMSDKQFWWVASAELLTQTAVLAGCYCWIQMIPNGEHSSRVFGRIRMSLKEVLHRIIDLSA